MAQLREDIAGCSGTLTDEVQEEVEALHLRYYNPAP
jgi:hypothetical protein